MSTSPRANRAATVRQRQVRGIRRAAEQLARPALTLRVAQRHDLARRLDTLQAELLAEARRLEAEITTPTEAR